MICDLHCHSTSSDGTHSPAQLMREAAKAGLGMIALTDHDTVAGCAEAQQTISDEKLPVSLVQGVELSIDASEDELHVLGLFIDPANKPLQSRLNDFKEDREARIYKIIARLEQLGYPLQADEVLALAQGQRKTLGRPHVAAALVSKGYFANVQEVFDKLLYFQGPAYVTHLKPGLAEAINLIHGAKGLAVVAHPYKVKDIGLLEEAVKLGIDGIEAYYPEHTPEMLAFCKKFAQERQLKLSGGSDFHGIKGRYPARLGIYSLSVQMLNLW